MVEQKGILRKHGLFCIANVLDLAALYVPQNSDLVKQLFEQVFLSLRHFLLPNMEHSQGLLLSYSEFPCLVAICFTIVQNLLMSCDAS